MRRMIWVVLGLAVATLVSCSGGTGASTDDGKVNVVATTGMVGDAAVRIGGEHVTVVSLMGPGVDPHLYKATASDTARLREADLILYNGLHLEGKMTDILASIGQTRPAYAIAETVPKDRLRTPPEFEGLADPHLWFDVSLWRRSLEQVLHALVEVDPAHKDDYETAAAQYFDELDALHDEVKREILLIPEGQRVLVTAHDAFGYFGRAYGMDVVGLQGMSTVSGFSVKDVERISNLLVERNVRAIFVESSVPRKAIESVVQNCKDRGHEVLVGGELFSDAMGEAGTPEGTYVGMVRHNLHTIVGALTGGEE